MSGHAIHIKVDGRTYSGTYKVDRQVLTVTTKYGKKTATVGPKVPHAALADQLRHELVREEKAEKAPLSDVASPRLPDFNAPRALRISAPEHSAPVVTVPGQNGNGAVPIGFEFSLAAVERLLLLAEGVLLTLDGERVQVLQILLSRSRPCEGGLSSGGCRADSSEEQSDQNWYHAAQPQT